MWSVPLLGIVAQATATATGRRQCTVDASTTPCSVGRESRLASKRRVETSQLGGGSIGFNRQAGQPRCGGWPSCALWATAVADMCGRHTDRQGNRHAGHVAREEMEERAGCAVPCSRMAWPVVA